MQRLGNVSTLFPRLHSSVAIISSCAPMVEDGPWSMVEDGRLIMVYIYIYCNIYMESLCIYIYIYWLVVSTYPSEKYEFVSWDDDIPNIWKNKNVPNHQPVEDGRLIITHMRTMVLVYLPTKLGHLWGKCWDSYSIHGAYGLMMINGSWRLMIMNNNSWWTLVATSHILMVHLVWCDKHDKPPIGDLLTRVMKCY